MRHIIKNFLQIKYSRVPKKKSRPFWVQYFIFLAAKIKYNYILIKYRNNFLQRGGQH